MSPIVTRQVSRLACQTPDAKRERDRQRQRETDAERMECLVCMLSDVTCRVWCVVVEGAHILHFLLCCMAWHDNVACCFIYIHTCIHTYIRSYMLGVDGPQHHLFAQ